MWQQWFLSRRIAVACFLCGIINCCNLLLIQNSQRFQKFSKHESPSLLDSSQSHPVRRKGMRSLKSDDAEDIVGTPNAGSSNGTNVRAPSMHPSTKPSLSTNHSYPEHIITSTTPSPIRAMSREEGVAELVLLHRIPFGLKDRPDASPFEYSINTSLPIWQQMLETKQAAVTRVANDQVPLPRPPLNVFSLRNDTRLDSNQPVLTILAATRSYPKQQGIASTNLQKRLIPSLAKTISIAEQKLWSIQLWIAVDDSDTWWLEHWHEITNVPDWMDVFFAVFPDELHRIPFNEVAYLAYNASRPDYLCRVNDDSEFTSSGWITLAAETLVHLTPPNVGVVGPSCKQGNTQILTHDFVHASHMEIFDGLYYPPVFKNWYLDDYVSVVYSKLVLGEKFHRVFRPKEWSVKHWLSTKRYESTSVDSQWLPFEYEIGLRKIRNFVKQYYPTSESFLPLSIPEPTDPTTYRAIRELIKSDGNLLVWGMDFQETPAIHRLSSGRVLFLEDPLRPQPNKNIVRSTCSSACHILGNFPYLQHESVMYTMHRSDSDRVYQTLQEDVAENKMLDLWCGFQLPLFPSHIEETDWDMFFVDGSALQANSDYGGPGPFQAVFMTMYILSRRQTDKPRYLLIRGHTSTVEQQILDKLLGRPPDQAMQLDSLVLYVFNGKDAVQDPSAGCPKALLRIPQHFHGYWSRSQVQSVVDILPIHANLLVFGLQNDPTFWSVSTRGQIQFIENEALKIARGSGKKSAIEVFQEEHPNFKIHSQKVRVRNSPHILSRALNENRTASFSLEKFSGISWNVLLLSSMEQSIFQSLVDARQVLRQRIAEGLTKDIHIFVDHYEKEPVMNFAVSIFSRAPVAIHERVEKRKSFRLAHFKFPSLNGAAPSATAR